MAAALRNPDLDVLILDSAVTRAPPCAAGAREKRAAGGQAGRELGRSRGGFGTKIRGSFNGLGQPVEPLRTPGRASDIGPAEVLLAGCGPEVVIADRGHDSDALVGAIADRGAEAVIPPRSNRVEPREYDRHTYRERNLCERLWSKAKRYRRVATRSEERVTNFLAFARLASDMVMLK